jgi:uncharacterized protein YpmS
VRWLAAIDPLTIAKEAYDKDFRWWFLILLGLMISSGLWAFKYLLKKNEDERAMHDRHIATLMGELTSSRQNHHDRVEKLTAEAFAVTRELTAVVSANNKVIEANTRALEKLNGHS